MSNSPTERPTLPRTVWSARGRHVGPVAPAPEYVLRENLRQLKESGVLDDFTEPHHDGADPDGEVAPERIFEARWRVADGVTVRARLTLTPPDGRDPGHAWLLVAEAERPWDERWPSPATMFWPDTPVSAEPADTSDAAWDHHHVLPELRYRSVNALPADDKDMRRMFKSCAREGWGIHVVVHEAMTPDARGRLPLTRLLPPELRHRVIEHRATPHQLRAVNWALKDLGVEVPRGGAVVLPASPAPIGYDAQEFSVRSVFLEGGAEPTELFDAVRRYADLPKPPPQGAEEALTDLRENWTLLTLQEELARERRLVAKYREALEAMTTSRDLYREAAERANEALAAFREGAVPAPAAPEPEPDAPAASPFQQISRRWERFRDTAKALRPATETPRPPETAQLPETARLPETAGLPDAPGLPETPGAPGLPEVPGVPESRKTSDAAAETPADRVE
ncbi:hypothetical protein [Streptomyces mangrovisoli]|uniref:Uncharacterized protein n=1 Tax=Streptomyces mangrovisoli TaxID=1428628 RepID=A0A1J4P4L1_9ACTN|nr:hypothetical protein [Streptomyces mangrovisoli]OIJ69138.1 hypothetical protein WN71_004170 [Streptomyces mangrovisoli]